MTQIDPSKDLTEKDGNEDDGSQPPAQVQPRTKSKYRISEQGDMQDQGAKQETAPTPCPGGDGSDWRFNGTCHASVLWLSQVIAANSSSMLDRTLAYPLCAPASANPYFKSVLRVPISSYLFYSKHFYPVALISPKTPISGWTLANESSQLGCSC